MAFTFAWVAMTIGLYLGSLHLFFIPHGKALCQAHHASYSQLVFRRIRGNGPPMAPWGVECRREDLRPGDPAKYFPLKGEFFSSNSAIEFICRLSISLGYLFGPPILILFLMPKRRRSEEMGVHFGSF